MADTSLCRKCRVKLASIAPEGLCLNCWKVLALTLTVSQLRIEFVNAGKGELFEAIKIFLTRENATVSCEQLAAAFGIPEAALKTTISRMRRRCQQLFREALANIPGNPFGITDGKAELRALFKTVASLPTNRGTFLIAPLSALIGEVKDRPAPAEPLN